MLPILVLSYPIDYLISKELSKSNEFPGEFEVWNDIYSSNTNCELAIYGSSRAWVHIDPEVLEDTLAMPAYNFGMDGQNFWLQYMRHKEYLKYNSKPKAIVIAVDAFSLEKKAGLYNLNQFLPYMLWNKNMTQYTSSYEGFDYVDYYLPLIRYHGRKNVLTELVKDMNDENTKKKVRNKGFKGIDRPWSNELDQAREKLNSYQAHIDSASLELFDLFIQECISLNIQLIMVYPPEYIEGQKFIANKEEITMLFENFAKKYDIEYIDYSMDSLCFQKKWFYNSMHLNYQGANIFSMHLATDLKYIMKNK